MAINNGVNLTGRLVKDPEIKIVGKSDIGVVQFTLAVSRKFSKDKTDFIQCTAWRHQATYLSKYAKSGDLISVSGEIHTGNFDDDEKGKVFTVTVNVEEVQIRAKAEKNIKDEPEPEPEPELEVKPKPKKVAKTEPKPQVRKEEKQPKVSDDYKVDDMQEETLPF